MPPPLPPPLSLEIPFLSHERRLSQDLEEARLREDALLARERERVERERELEASIAELQAVLDRRDEEAALERATLGEMRERLGEVWRENICVRCYITRWCTSLS